MRTYLRTPAVMAWAVLVAAALAAWALGAGIHAAANPVLLSLLLVITFAKVWIIGDYFMGLRNAPLYLKALYTGWCIAICLTLIALAVVA